MKIDITSKNAMYIEIGDLTYYIDNSTNEQILHVWNTKSDKTIIDTLLAPDSYLKDVSIVDFYLEYVNNFISVNAIAEYYGISTKTAKKMISIGREINNKTK